MQEITVLEGIHGGSAPDECLYRSAPQALGDLYHYGSLFSLFHFPSFPSLPKISAPAIHIAAPKITNPFAKITNPFAKITNPFAKVNPLAPVLAPYKALGDAVGNLATQAGKVVLPLSSQLLQTAVSSMGPKGFADLIQSGMGMLGNQGAQIADQSQAAAGADVGYGPGNIPVSDTSVQGYQDFMSSPQDFAQGAGAQPAFTVGGDGFARDAGGNIVGQLNPDDGKVYDGNGNVISAYNGFYGSGLFDLLGPIAQIAAPIVGTAIGGPVGAVGGQVAGDLIGNLLGQHVAPAVGQTLRSAGGGSQARGLAAAAPVGRVSAPAGQYVVRQGDTMGQIAAAHGMPLQTLINLNPEVRNPNLIFPGQILRLADASVRRDVVPVPSVREPSYVVPVADTHPVNFVTDFAYDHLVPDFLKPSPSRGGGSDWGPSHGGGMGGGSGWIMPLLLGVVAGRLLPKLFRD